MEKKFPFSTDPKKWQTAYTVDNAYYDTSPIAPAASRLRKASFIVVFLYGVLLLFASLPLTLQLFDMDRGFAAELDQGQISASLREVFRSHGWPLTDRASLTIQLPGNEWIIQDKDIEYIIRAEGETLDVKGKRNGVMFLLRDLFVKKYLFSLNIVSMEALDAGSISNRDREVFSSHGKPLSADAIVVMKRAGVKWIILDQGKRYLIKNERQSLRVYENQTWAIVLGIIVVTFLMTYIVFLLVKKSAFRRAQEFFREFYAPPEGVIPAEVIEYRIGGRIKLPMPFSEWFPSISQFKYILAQNGDFLKKDEWPVWAARTLGGPILLIVFDGSALYLERGNQFSRVVGPGVSFLERHETIKYPVDLRNKVKEAGDKDAISVWTKDGITVKLKARIAYRIGDPQKLKDTPNLIHPYDPEAVKKAIERYAFRWPDPNKEPEEFTWEDAVWGQVTGIVPGYIGKHFLDDLLIADREKGQILSPSVSDDLFKDLNKATQAFGVYVLDFQILSIELPQSVHKYYVQYWEAEKQGHATRMSGRAKAFEIRAREKAKADAQHDLILTIARSLQKNKKDITEALLLSLSEVLDHGLSDPYMRSYIGKETIETLEKLEELLK